LLDLVHGAERVPATLLLPPGARSAPVALLLHGFSSSKERMVHSVGRALLQRGVASLALDLPFHGERDGGGDAIPYRNPLALVRRAVDPLRAVRKLRGRPLLLVNGRSDRTTRPAQAERLFAYAEEPKELRWYEGGHWPPASAIEDAAQWTAERLHGPASRTGRRQAG
jgi:fermentation-respiration switch protein FrsA (DUF1100 family)